MQQRKRQKHAKATWLTQMMSWQSNLADLPLPEHPGSAAETAVWVLAYTSAELSIVTYCNPRCSTSLRQSAHLSSLLHRLCQQWLFVRHSSRSSKSRCKSSSRCQRDSGLSQKLADLFPAFGVHFKFLQVLQVRVGSGRWMPICNVSNMMQLGRCSNRRCSCSSSTTSLWCRPGEDEMRGV